MVLSDLHTHSTFCDGKNTPEEMLREAERRGFAVLGISAHSPMAVDCPFGMRDPDAFVAATDPLRKRTGPTRFLRGCELDAYGELTYDADYVITSAHYVKRGGKYYMIDHAPELQRELIDEACGGVGTVMTGTYFETLVEAVLRTRPTVVGHFDVIRKFNREGAFFDEHGEEYLRQAREAIDAILPVCRLFEVNTGAIFRGWRDDPYPAGELLSYLLSRGGEVILSSDAHRTDAIGYRFPEAQALLREVGFAHLTVMTPSGLAREPIQ